MIINPFEKERADIEGLPGGAKGKEVAAVPTQKAVGFVVAHFVEPDSVTMKSGDLTAVIDLGMLMLQNA